MNELELGRRAKYKKNRRRNFEKTTPIFYNLIIKTWQVCQVWVYSS